MREVERWNNYSDFYGRFREFEESEVCRGIEIERLREGEGRLEV